MSPKTLLGIFFFIFITIISTACQTTNNSLKNGSSVASVSNDSAAVGDQEPQLVSRIVSSIGGGKGWQATYQTSSMDLASIRCVENQTCYALADGNAILRTTDGGKSWEKLASAGMVMHGDSPFACTKAGFCLLIESINGGNVWITRNGGTTWEKSGTSPANSPESLSCPSSERCLLITRKGEVYITTDGGVSWQIHLASSEINYKKITCLDEIECYITGMLLTGDFGVVVKTVDGGQTWDQDGVSPVGGLRDISCLTSLDCVSVGRFGAQVTHNGGQTWQEFSLAGKGARSVDCLSPKNCYIIDDQGQLLSWDGTNLVSQSVAGEFSLRSVSCPPGGKCYMVGAFNAKYSNLPLLDFGNNLNVLFIGLIFLAGIVSFLSPSVLSVFPGYVTHLAARSSNQEIEKLSRWQVLSHGMAFVAGFSIVFITLGAVASAIGQSLYGHKEWITRLGGVMIVFFGLQMAGLLRIPFLKFEIRKHADLNPRLGYISSLLMGVFFTAKWTSSVGLILGIVLTLAGIQASITQGILLLALFSLGLGLPIIITTLAMGQMGKWMSTMANLTKYVTLVMGILLVGAGLLLILGQLNFFREFFPGLAI